MTQHRLEKVYGVDNTKSSDLELSLDLLNVTSTKFPYQHALTIAHVDVSMNLNKRWHVSKNKKKTNY
jgi:hypothetical protein